MGPEFRLQMVSSLMYFLGTEWAHTDGIWYGRWFKQFLIPLRRQRRRCDPPSVRGMFA